MGIGNRDSNLVRLARLEIENQDAGNETKRVISQDIDGAPVLRRIRIERMTIQASAAASYIFRIYTKATRNNTPGSEHYSLLYENTVTNSADLQTVTATIPYVDEDATKNTSMANVTYNEARARIYLELVTTAGNNIDFSISIAYKQ